MIFPTTNFSNFRKRRPRSGSGTKSIQTRQTMIMDPQHWMMPYSRCAVLLFLGWDPDPTHSKKNTDLSFVVLLSWSLTIVSDSWVRIRIQHFRLNTDPFWWPKIWQIWSKIAIYLFLGLNKGRPSYRRSHQNITFLFPFLWVISGGG